MVPLLIGVIFAVGAMAQRPPYASNRPYPGLLPRFREQANPQNSPNSTDDNGLGNRDNVPTTAAPTLAPELSGTLEEDALVSRVGQWPEDRQPFWFKNRNAIFNNRHQSINGNPSNDSQNQQNFSSNSPTARSGFLPSGGNRRNSDHEKWLDQQRNGWRKQRPINSGQRSSINDNDS